MSPALSVPVTVMPDALEFVARKGLQDVWERSLAYVSQTAADASSIRVRLDYDRNADCPCVCIGVVVEADETIQERLRELYYNWLIENLPRESYFSLAIDIIPG